MRYAAFAMLLFAFVLLAVATTANNRSGAVDVNVVIDCSAWPSIEECIREGVAPNWQHIEGIEFVGP